MSIFIPVNSTAWEELSNISCAVYFRNSSQLSIYNKLRSIGRKIQWINFVFGGVKIKALMVAPGEHPREVTLINELDALQKAVSIGAGQQGCIEIILLEDTLCLLYNEGREHCSLIENELEKHKKILEIEEGVLRLR